ncbi:MAG TPA: helix-hairpin-helix domain-containing protein [Solimonas sp.]|jgi:competence protein ComEA|nr:helix-hairpin-helix domain-containing protein [Solimonas sp.]
MKKILASFALLLATTAASAGMVNINTADARMLDKALEGVGPVKAAAIVEYRSKNGPFKSAEDLKKVEGIGPAIIEANKDNLKIKD